MKDYSIDADTIVAMMTYCNLTPPLVDEITKAMTALMDAYDSESKNLVQAHTAAYKKLLMDCSELMKQIAGNIEGSANETQRRAKLYQNILSKKL